MVDLFLDAAAKQGAVPEEDAVAIKKRLFEAILASEAASLSKIADVLDQVGHEVARL